MDKPDMILLMSVNPGFGGQKFIPGTLKKIEQVRKLIDESGHDIRLEVDGGVSEKNIGEVAKAGCAGVTPSFWAAGAKRKPSQPR